jgi:PhoPQ-activated pathogenicity-related protein
MSGNERRPLRSRRQFGAESLAAVAASSGLVRSARGQALVETDAGILAAYAEARDPSTRTELLGEGELAGGRFRIHRLVSQTWRGTEWMHELSIFAPAGLPADVDTMLLWIDGGKSGRLPEVGATPGDALKTLALAANAAGLPAAVVRQVPFQPMFDGLVEDDLIAHTFVEYARSGDPSWPLLLPMVKSAVEAMTSATAAARDAWGMAIEGFVVTGASKRGWTTWLTAAVDERVRGALPMVIDMLSMERHVELQHASFGGMSEALEPYTSVGIEKLLGSPRGRALIEIVDPYAYRERIVQPKVIALGTNDPYWPLEALDLYLTGLAGPRWVSYTPNAGHGLPIARVCGLVAGLGRHVTGAERMPQLEWAFAPTATGTACVVRATPEPAEVLVWRAAAESRDFREARWAATPVARAEGAWRAEVDRPTRGFQAALVECRYPREPLPLLLTTSVHVQRAS